MANKSTALSGSHISSLRLCRRCGDCNHKLKNEDTKCIYCGATFDKSGNIVRSNIDDFKKKENEVEERIPQKDKEQSAENETTEAIKKIKNKKVLFGSIAVLFVLVMTYIYALPYITFYKIKSALDEGNTEALEEYVDFDSVKESLKTQMKTFMVKSAMENIKKDRKTSGAAVIGMGIGVTLAGKMADNLIDTLVTPEGITMLIHSGGKLPTERKRTSSTTPKKSKKDRYDFFRNADLGYESASKFSARIKDEKEKELILILRRDGLSWKLSDLKIPFK